MSGETLSDGLRETLSAFDEPGVPLTTPEVAERMGIGRRSTYNRLERLVDANRVDTKKVGANARVWWRPVDGVSGADRSTCTDGDEPAKSGGDVPPTDQHAAFESLVEGIDAYAVFTLDPEGNVRTWNAGAERIQGYEADEILRQHVSTFYTDADREAGVPERNLEAAAIHESIEETGWRVRADGSRFWATVTITAIYDDDGDLDGFAKLTRDMTEVKERERELERYETLFEESKDVNVIVDEEGRFSYLTPSAENVFGYDQEELVGEVGFDYIHPDDRPRAMAEFQRMIDRPEYEPEIECRFERADGSWIVLEALARDLRDDPDIGSIVVYTRDVTDRVERERDLERYETIVETAREGIYVVDGDGYFTEVNEAYAEMTGYDREELVGAHVTTVIDESVSQEANRLTEELAAGDRSTASLEAELTRPDGETWIGDATFALMDEREERIGVVRDVTERRLRERELEESRRRYRTLVDNFPNGAVVLLDENLQYQTVGGTPALERPGEDIEGESLYDVAPEQHESRFVAACEDALDGETSRFERTVGDRTYQFWVLPVRDEDGDVFAIIRMSQDVTGRKRRERRLQRRVRQQAVSTDLGQRALASHDVDALMAEAALLVSETLDTDYSKVLDLAADGETLTLRQGVGWDDGIVGTASVSATDDQSQAAYTLRSDEPVVVENLDAESRFDGPALLTDHDVASGISTIVGPVDEPWGILGTHNRRERSFSDQDVNFVQSVANILASAIERHDYERRLEHQREQLAALNSLNDTVREITDAVIDQSTREQIEQTVCERLPNTESYAFAWIGDVDTSSQTVRPRAEAGTGGYLDEITITVDSDDERSEGPTGKALRTGEIQVVQDSTVDSAHDPWRDHVETYDFRSSAAVPISHEGTVYGVLNIYAERPYAFETQERRVIAQLGEVVGHAIAATERKRALMSDEVTELTFTVQDVLDRFGVESKLDGRITFDRAVPVGDGEFLEYGTVDAQSLDVLEAFVDRLDHFEDLRIVDEAADPLRFELLLSEPPVVSVVAANGGYLDEAVIENGDFHLGIHLPPTVDARRIIDEVRDAYPDAEPQSTRQITRSDDTLACVHRAVTEDLSDRQRATLEAALHSGFFEWPREATGEEVGESLGIAPATFSQHLRKGQKTVFESVFSAST